MLCYFQTTTIYCIFIFVMCLPGGRTQQFSLHNRRDTEPKAYARDPTKGLSDAEIDMALDDLSLADLSVLSKLIDRPNAPDYDYVDYDSRNYALGPPRDHTFDDNHIDDEVNKNYYDDVDEPPRDARNLYYKIPRQSFLPIMGQSENQRPKRENGHEKKQYAMVGDEYIRQLEDSFPRDQEQNNNEESDDKKEHIRVKRN